MKNNDNQIIAIMNNEIQPVGSSFVLHRNSNGVSRINDKLKIKPIEKSEQTYINRFR
jgi:hypothetical protein